MKNLLITLLAFTLVSCGPDTKETKYPDGSIKERFEFITDDNGSELKNGEYIQYYHNGQIRKKGMYKDNLTTGKWKKWDIKGNLTNEYAAQDGYFTGEEISYNTNGDIIEKKTYTDEGNLTHLLEYNQEGILIKDITLEEGHNKSILGKWKMLNRTYEFLENGTVLIGDRKMKGSYQATADKIRINGITFNIFKFTTDSIEYGKRSFTNSMVYKGKRI